MKTSTLTLALAAATVASVNAQDNCAILPILGFLVDANAKLCATETTIAWKPFRVYNETEIAAYCATPSCLTFLATLPPLNPVECRIPASDYPLLYKDLLDKIAKCPATTPAPATSSPVTPTPTTTAPTPEPTSVAPTPEPTTVVPTPAPTTAAPVPAPTTVTPSTSAPSTTPEPTLPVKPSC